MIVCLEDEGIPKWLIDPICPGYEEVCRQVSYDSARSLVHHLRKFSGFVEASGISTDPLYLPQDVLFNFASWLRLQQTKTGKPYANASMSGTFGAVKALIKTSRRLNPAYFEHIQLPNHSFQGKSAVGKVSLDTTTLSKILEAANSEAESVWEQYRNMIRTNAPDKELRLFLSADRIYPFYLCLLIITAGNPGPITQIDIGCLRTTEAAAIVEIEWFKPRAGSTERIRSKRDQKVSIDTIVKRVIELTSRLRVDSKAHASSKLFIFHQQGGGGKGFKNLDIRILTMGYTIQLRQRFIARNNLPKFIEKDIRPVVLAAHANLEKGRTLATTQAVANHKYVEDTLSYVRRDRHHDEAMQGRLAAVMGSFAGRFTKDYADDGHSSTALGPKCSDLVNNRPEDETKEQEHSKPCLSYLRCFTCRHATIPTQDLETAARLMAAQTAFEDAQQRVSKDRWEQVLEPLMLYIKNDLLPRFPLSIRKRALKKATVYQTVEIW